MPRRFKILSDFDGVWTRQGPEAALLLDWTVAQLAQLRGVESAQARDELAPLLAAMRNAPADNGWAPDGRISAYVDEDPLIETSALARVLDRARCETSARYKQAVLAAGYSSMSAFGEHAFRTGTEAFREQHPTCLVPDAADRLAAIRAAGAEVVIVSNSETDKIRAWFGLAGVDAGEGDTHDLRVRGSAMKWRVGPDGAAIDVAGRKVWVDRPHYRDAIVAENPDLIIGDVFSLDLALPHAMRTRGVAQAPRALVLHRHPHTPPWILRDRAGGAIDHIVDSLAELPAILAVVS